jgi:hypothetical protein
LEYTPVRLLMVCLGYYYFIDRKYSE